MVTHSLNCCLSIPQMLLLNYTESKQQRGQWKRRENVWVGPMSWFFITSLIFPCKTCFSTSVPWQSELWTATKGCQWHPQTKCTFSVGVDGVEEPTLGRGMLSTSSRTFWILRSEILMCSSGSSPDTLNLKHQHSCSGELAERLDSCLKVSVLPGHPGVLLHHTLGQVEGEVHRLEDVLTWGTLQQSSLPGLTWVQFIADLIVWCSVV